MELCKGVMSSFTRGGRMSAMDGNQQIPEEGVLRTVRGPSGEREDVATWPERAHTEHRLGALHWPDGLDGSRG